MTKQTAVKRGYTVEEDGRIICDCGKPLLNKLEQEVYISIKV